MRKRTVTPTADSKPADIGTYRTLEQILRRNAGWADEIVTPFALKRNRRAIRARQRAA